MPEPWGGVDDGDEARVKRVLGRIGLPNDCRFDRGARRADSHSINGARQLEYTPRPQCPEGMARGAFHRY
jgi:hypothetical protein